MVNVRSMFAFWKFFFFTNSYKVVLALIVFNQLLKMRKQTCVNPSCPDPGQREKINWSFYFSDFFVMPQNVLWRPWRPSRPDPGQGILRETIDMEWVKVLYS